MPASKCLGPDKQAGYGVGKGQGARLVSALIGSKVQLCFGWEYSRGFTGFKQGYRGRTNAPEFQGIYFIYSIYVYAWYIPLYSYIYIYIYIYI